jgi:hypothetical protein
LEERDQEKSSEMHRMEALMRSSIELDNMIVLEAAILQKQFDDNFIDLSMILEAIRKIRSYAQENSRMVTSANNLLREMGEYLLED